ncbi:MAG: endonuclease MutS2 [Lachnospiraceae bacterium]|jgi:DNA mismatch repair protein MutS2|nr:endonuclease MutS2 [Lachnospiraceae bacterium]
MNPKTLEKLEYTKIIAMLIEVADSIPGKAACQGLMPLFCINTIKKAQEETRDALSRLLKNGSVSFGGNHEIGASLRSLEIEQAISTQELLHIAALLETTKQVKQYSEAEDSLVHLFDALEPLTHIAVEIRRAIIAEDIIADDASPGLRQVRRSMAQTGAKIHSLLTGMVNGAARTYLQDAVITMRDNRYCIPVKSEFKNQVPGMIHDKSSSGSTFFIEPAAVVNLNNQLREHELREKEEIALILMKLSSLAGESVEIIAKNHELLTELDFIFAKGKLALSQNATMPLMNEERYLSIRKGRHPLINAENVVAIDIRLGRDFDQLVVTGPNTGGKTVSLKTVGLFTLMGQAGLHIPAADRSKLAVFRNVFADIGDEQSIEQSLSTFSSHMTAIVDILTHADHDSLCLFDELGAGTDPTEGAALAIAILRYLHQNQIMAMATTHYSELKLFAIATDGVENASCEFDLTTLRPTYRLLIGIPGKSNAFAISTRLGLPDFIINDAREQIHSDAISFEDVIGDIEQSRVKIEREQTEIAASRLEIKTLEERLRDKNEKIDKMRAHTLREAEEEARQILEDAKEFADQAIRTLQKSGDITHIREMEQIRDGLREQIKNKQSKLRLRVETNEIGYDKNREPTIGDQVKILSMGLTGTVNTLPCHKGNLFVQCGVLRTNVHKSDVVLLAKNEIKQNEKTESIRKEKHGKIDLASAGDISYELHLRGQTVDEAIAELDKYLDSAYLSQMPSARIVHGKGTGTLRQAVHRHLRRLNYVRSFRLGEYGEGDTGVTVVEFKR